MGERILELETKQWFPERSNETKESLESFSSELAAAIKSCFKHFWKSKNLAKIWANVWLLFLSSSHVNSLVLYQPIVSGATARLMAEYWLCCHEALKEDEGHECCSICRKWVKTLHFHMNGDGEGLLTSRTTLVTFQQIELKTQQLFPEFTSFESAFVGKQATMHTGGSLLLILARKEDASQLLHLLMRFWVGIESYWVVVFLENRALQLAWCPGSVSRVTHRCS